MDRRRLLAVARGEEAADLVLRGGRVLNVFSGQIEDGVEIALCGDTIAGLGVGYRGRATVELAGSFVAPGLIDAHVHLESSLCVPAHFAAAVVPRGVTTVVADPHEIANVAGVAGIRFLERAGRHLPLTVVTMAPSTVPASHLETSGGRLDAEDLADLLHEGVVHGLAEMMNFPGVVGGQPDLLAKLAAFANRPIDGHGPGLSGRQLNAYVAAGVGSEHECTTVAEATEKLARGLYILIREATNAHNLQDLLPLVTPENSRRICFCTDDRVPGDLLDQGSVDHMVREAIRFGIPPVQAWRMATLNPAEWFGLHRRGAIGPGRRADLVVFDDLQAPVMDRVYAAGRLVAEEGHLLAAEAGPQIELPEALQNTVHIAWDRLTFSVPAPPAATEVPVRVIGVVPNQLTTLEWILPLRVRQGELQPDVERDILKISVVDRHTASGRQGIGFVQGFGLKQGAMAGTIAHDHHNLVVIGADDASMLRAAQAVGQMNGGLAVAGPDGVLARLPLPIAGLMSHRPIDEVRTAHDELLQAARGLGSPLHDPFMAMSFMALPVIPALKITDRGLVDVTRFDVVPLTVP